MQISFVLIRLSFEDGNIKSPSRSRRAMPLGYTSNRFLVAYNLCIQIQVLSIIRTTDIVAIINAAFIIFE